MTSHRSSLVAVLRAGVLAAATFSVFAGRALAETKPASIFGQGMVIQRDRPAPVWGTADAGTKVTVTLGDQTAETTADANGKWQATLPAGPAGGPFTLSIKDGQHTQTLTDVYRGDVWLCSGQSNMQMSLGEADDGKATAAKAARHTKLRLCKVGQAWTDQPQTDAKVQWSPATPETAEKFSAVGYFFADKLLESPEMRNVPVGLIESVLGGTLAEAWAPQQELAGIDPKKISNSMFGIGPTTLYNGMIAPLGPVGLKGVVWYQGEGNSGDPESYPAKLSAVIRGWRKQFQNDAMPFLIIQLPDYAPSWGGTFWQWTRDAQRQVAESLPHVGLVTAINTNDGLDLHPKPKQAIGVRAALLARQTVYNEKIVGYGPVFEKAVPNGNLIEVTFKTNGSELSATNLNDAGGFLVAGEDGKFRRAKARLAGRDSVIVTSEFVPSPKFVRYAWAGVPNAGLTNREGLPAYPFRTDTFPIDHAGLQPQSGAQILGTQTYEITIAGEWPTSLTVKGKQLLSNETGLASGVNMPSFLGPRGFGQLTELGPDLFRLGGEQLNLTIDLEESACTWTIKNNGNDAEPVRINLSPAVKVSPLQGDKVELTRPGLTATVTGIENVSPNDGLNALELKAKPKATTTVRFEFRAD